MALKIGVVSPELPSRLPGAYAQNDCSLLWFNEIEAAFAYLVGDVLDKLIIDLALMDAAAYCTKKYQKMIAQLHPRLAITMLPVDIMKIRGQEIDVVHFPRLDTLFKNGELRSVFQPIVHASGDHPIIHGVECLSRIVFNQRSYAPEFIFNYAAEKLKLTNYDKICLMQAVSLAPRNSNAMIFVNVRPQTLIGENFSTWFKSLLKQYHLEPEQIVIEVTEQYCNVAEAEISMQCQQLKHQGFSLAIDDFGAGISNHSMIELMKPSYIKISGRFIKRSHDNEDKQKIIKNILSLAADFNIIPIVECVEKKEEWQLVHKLGARLAQGFYFHRPMCRDELSGLLKKKSLTSANN